MVVITKETTDEIFVTMQVVLQLLEQRVYVFDYRDVVACAELPLRNLKENTFLRWFNNPLWTVKNKTVWFDWGKKRPMFPTKQPTVTSLIGLETVLVGLGLPYMVKFHRIHCMGYKCGIPDTDNSRRYEKKLQIRECLQAADKVAALSPPNQEVVCALYKDLLTSLLITLLQDECTHRGHYGYYQKPIEQGQKYVIHVPRHVTKRRGGVTAQPIAELFKNSKLPGVPA